jgi:hypothetical protein
MRKIFAVIISETLAAFAFWEAYAAWIENNDAVFKMFDLSDMGMPVDYNIASARWRKFEFVV